jgi:ABC-type multidrug transport system ATPase subunit
MVIQLEDIGKRFGMEWIFKGINFAFESDSAYAITGPNGSGKSTLLKIISLSMTPSKGNVRFIIPGHRNTDMDAMMREVAFAAPYISLVQDFTLAEMVAFHYSFRQMQVDDADFWEISGLKTHRNKIIRHFSSGMMQRLKLSLSILSKTPVLLLDEPASNLDKAATQWYLGLIHQFTSGRVVIIGSNQPEEYAFAKTGLHIPDYK